jgi:hypothetical protein
VTGSNHAEGAGSSIELLLWWIIRCTGGQRWHSCFGPLGVGPSQNLAPSAWRRGLVGLGRCQIASDAGHLGSIPSAHGHPSSMTRARSAPTAAQPACR